jgi:succinoglycan biosynthesis protein ExoA
MQLALRQRSLSAFLAAPAAVTMHLAWASGFFSGFLRHRERTWQREMATPLELAGDGS